MAWTSRFGRDTNSLLEISHGSPTLIKRQGKKNDSDEGKREEKLMNDLFLIHLHCYTRLLAIGRAKGMMTCEGFNYRIL